MRVAIVKREPKVAISMDVYTANLVTQLKEIKPDWEIIEVAPKPWSKDLENLWASGNPLRKYYERFYNHPRAVSRIEADIFHIIDHTDGHIAYSLKKLGKPVVITCHDLVQYVYPDILKNESRIPALSMAALKYSIRGSIVADRTIAVSSNTAKDINQWLNIDPRQVETIFNGVESVFRRLPAEVVQDWRSQYARSPEEICLLNVGSTHQNKNIPTVLKVVKAIADKEIPVRLWKVGDDFIAEQKQFIKDNALEPYISFVGKPDLEGLIRFYNAADVLLAPSLYEGFGLTILETMTCGTPVITSNVSSLPEVAGDAAVLVEPTDVNAITEAVLRIDRDSAFREDLIIKGLSRCKEFTWRKTAEQVARVYEQIVNS